MSWIVKNQSKLNHPDFPDEFVLISMPKSGGYSIEKLFETNGYKLSRPKGLNLIGHYTFLDTYLRLKNSHYSYLKDYLIPIRETIKWRKSYYQYVKHQPVDSGMYYLSEIFKNFTFEDYVKKLVEGSFNKLNSINNLAVIPKSSFLTNNLYDKSFVTDVNVYVYDMTEGFSSLFRTYFGINIKKEIISNKPYKIL
jgi:hypothetical protein